ncbi:MAG: hypothetical protein EXQ95_05085 [Alphaproteobacteria bacterium]|nr:hypothetical protein [Alphaproteobacteria bacterium]
MRRILIVALAALGLGEAAAQSLPSKGPDLHLGVTSCGGSTCHGAVQPVRGSQVLQNEYLIWQRQDKHAKAYAVLLEPRSQRIAKNLGLPDAHTAKACLDCHTDNVPAELRGRQFQLSDGVGCEGCHGGGQRWLGPHVAGVSSTAELQKLGLFPTEDPVARAGLCLSCHLGDETRFVTHRLMGAGHPRLSFELDTFTEIQPSHYVLDDDYRKRKTVASGVQTWAVGQAMAVGRTMAALADDNRRMAGVFPELTFYDCHACHHPMSSLRWQARESTGLAPGVIRFNDANLLMLRLLARRLVPEDGAALGGHLRTLHGAMSEGRGDAGAIAREIKAVADRLVQRFARHSFGPEDMRALLAALIAEGRQGQFADYGGAEQATMALASIAQALRRAGGATEAQYNELKAAIDQCYAATAKDEAYDPAVFARALEGVERAMPRS